MDKDIQGILRGWEYSPGELRVRRIKGRDGRYKVQVRTDLGLLQLEWTGRPDAQRPHGYTSLLDYYQERRRQWEAENPWDPFRLSSEDCWRLSQEATKYYWRRVSFFELREYVRAEEDALHNLAILDLCYHCGEAHEDRQLAEVHRSSVAAHRFQARAMARLDVKDYDGALREIRAGIDEIEGFLVEIGHQDRIEESPELASLREWEEEVESQRPITRRERLRSELREAVEREEYERAAFIRDRLQCLEHGESPGG